MKTVTIFLGGDVMTGRGIDQILPHPSSPQLYEPFVKDAREYVALAERLYGPIKKPVAYDYIWGEALAVWRRMQPAVRIVNLETSLTTSDDFCRDKDIHYRMHPQNIACLTEAKIDCCVLANNHILDWGQAGLLETLTLLHTHGIKTAGAGENEIEAWSPAIIKFAGGRVVIIALGHISSGIPYNWAADKDKPGVNFLGALSDEVVLKIKKIIDTLKTAGDIFIVSIHWGGNWGYEIEAEHQHFAHRLIDEAGVDIIHGHSSHHPKGLEVYRGKPILYGCGDFINDYEGISGFELFRGDLVLMYFIEVEIASGLMTSLTAVPLQIRNFRLNRASPADSLWLLEVLNQTGAKLGTRFKQVGEGWLALTINK